MAVKISGLPAASSAALTDQKEVNQGGVSKRVTTQQDFDLLNSANNAPITTTSNVALAVNLATQNNTTIIYNGASAEGNWTLPTLTSGDLGKTFVIKNETAYMLNVSSVSAIEQSTSFSLQPLESCILRVMFDGASYRYINTAAYSLFVRGYYAPALQSTNLVLTTPLAKFNAIQLDSGAEVRLPNMTTYRRPETGDSFTIMNAGVDPFDIKSATGATTWVSQLVAGKSATFTVTDNSTVTGDFEIVQLGTMATQNAASVAITGGTVNSLTHLSLVDTINSSLQASITNLSNTSSAKSQLFLSVAGESAGDATLTFSINGGNLFTMGLDNSDGNAFVLSKSNALGTSNLFRIAQDGTPSFTLIPLPLASGGLGATTAAGGRATLGLNVVNTISGTTYNTAAADVFAKNLTTSASAVTITVLDSAFAVGDEALYIQDGAGQVTFTPDAGVTINTYPISTNKIAGENGKAWLVKTATNTFYLSGDLTS